MKLEFKPILDPNSQYLTKARKSQAYLDPKPQP